MTADRGALTALCPPSALSQTTSQNSNRNHNSMLTEGNTRELRSIALLSPVRGQVGKLKHKDVQLNYH